MSTLEKRMYLDGVLTDPTSVFLSDITGTFGVKRNDTDAVVVADGTAMTNTAVGVYRHVFVDPANDLTYTYAIEWTHGGETHHVEGLLLGPTTASAAVDAYALCTLANAKTLLGITGSADDLLLARLINAVSDSVETYCGRQFLTRAHAARYDGNSQRFLYLPHHPVTAITRVSLGTNAAMSLTNSAAGAYAAYASMSSTTLTLTVDGGASAGTSTLTLADYADMDALAVAVNALGTGWTAVSMAPFNTWAASETGKHDFMGRECFDGTTIYLELPDERLSDVVLVDQQALYRAGGWPCGTRNVYVDYTAGFATIPDDLAQIALELVARAFYAREHDESIREERLGDYWRTLAESTFDDAMRVRLGRWRSIALGA